MEKLLYVCKRDLFFVAVLTVAVLFFWNKFFGNAFGLYMAECVGLAFYIICIEVPGYRLRKMKDKLYRELLIFFSRVKHRYMACHHIGNAILSAAENMSYEVNRLAEEVYYLLLETNRKDNIRQYIEHNAANRFMKLFMIQVYEVSEKGDQHFAENIEHLRLELMEEIYRSKKQNFEFAGYVFVAVTPFFMMPLLKQWGIQFSPELDYFYTGTGVLIETLTFGITILVYGLIIRAKELISLDERTKEYLWNTEPIYENKLVFNIIRFFDESEGKFSGFIRRLLLQAGERISYGRLCLRILTVILGGFLILTCFFTGLHGKEKKIILSDVEVIDIIAPNAGEEKKGKIKEHILSVTEQCIELEKVTEKQIEILLRENIKIHNVETEKAAIKEIQEKLKQYSESRMSIKEWIISIVISIGFGLFPVLKLYHQGAVVRARAVFEVGQFQSIVLMERKLQEVTIISLLEDMEAFSVCFRECLSRCINSYGNNPYASLVRLKEEGTALHEGFEEIADAFLSVDTVGIENAFAEVESNRRLLEKMTRLEAEINMEKKRDTTDILAKLPGILALGVYFIVPVFMHSLRGVYEVFEILEEMQL